MIIFVISKSNIVSIIKSYQLQFCSIIDVAIIMMIIALVIIDIIITIIFTMINMLNSANNMQLYGPSTSQAIQSSSLFFGGGGREGWDLIRTDTFDIDSSNPLIN